MNSHFEKSHGLALPEPVDNVGRHGPVLVAVPAAAAHPVRADPDDVLDRLPRLEHGSAAAEGLEEALEDDDMLRRGDQLLELGAVLQLGDVRDDQRHEEVDEDQRPQQRQADCMGRELT